MAPSADAYVDGANPAVNYGKNTALRTDASPDQRSYIRFTVPANIGTVTGATLHVYAGSGSSAGYYAALAGGGWTITSVTPKPPRGKGHTITDDGTAAQQITDYLANLQIIGK